MKKIGFLNCMPILIRYYTFRKKYDINGQSAAYEKSLIFNEYTKKGDQIYENP